ncbi:MAG: hypothetical protein V1843_01225 [bacterium]
MDIGRHFSTAWDIYIKNFMTLIISMVIVAVLSVLTLGILVPVLITGFQMMFIKLKRGQEVTTNDLFVYMNKFWILLCAAVVGAIAVMIGLILFIIPGLMIATLLMYALLLIADKDMDIGAAFSKSSEIVKKNNFWMHFLFVLVNGFIGNMGSSFYGVGALLTQPFAMGAIACAYDDEVSSS